MPGVRVHGQDVGQAYYIRNQYAKRDLFAQSFNDGCLAVRGSLAVAFGKLSNITWRGALSWWLYVSAMRKLSMSFTDGRPKAPVQALFARVLALPAEDLEALQVQITEALARRRESDSVVQAIPCELPLSLAGNELFPEDFAWDKCDARSFRVEPQADDFLPSSPLAVHPGRVTALLGFQNWWTTDSVKARLESMVAWFERREFIGSHSVLPSHQQQLLAADMCLYSRITRRSRVDTPSIQYAYKHYAHHLSMRSSTPVQACLAELMLNVMCVRSTLSLAGECLFFHPW